MSYWHFIRIIGRLYMTSVLPDGKFGAISIDNSNMVTSFQEKPKGDGSWITVDSLYVSLKFLIILKTTAQFSRGNLLKTWHIMNSCSHLNIMDSGNQWTLNVIRTFWTNLLKKISTMDQW